MNNGTDWPRLALVRKRVTGSLISIVALTEQWELRLPDPGQSFPGAYPSQDDQTIAAGAAPTAMEGTTLGLTVQPICVHEDYGPCTSGGLITRIFHATYPRSGSNAVKGISFEH